MIHGHGNDKYKYDKEIVADFSSNVWFQGTPLALAELIKDKVSTVSEYPEPDAMSLAIKVEAFFGLERGSAMITNGTAEAFYTIARYFSKKSSTIIIPSFAEYEDAARFNTHAMTFVMNSTLSDDYIFDTDMVWLGNPNNPDGKVFSIETIKSWLTNNHDTIFLIDEAYAELCEGYESVIPLINEFDNIIVIKSFTKSFAIPGLRLGAILGGIGLIDKLKFYMVPWSVNALAQEAGAYIIDNYQDLLFDKQLMVKLSNKMQAEISENECLEIVESDCNYFLLRLRSGESSSLKNYLIDNFGFLIRDASNFRGLTKQHFRLAIRDEESNNKLVAAIKEFCSKL